MGHDREAWKEAGEFASFLVDHLDDPKKSLLVAYQIMNKMGIPWTAMDDSDISLAIDSLCTFEDWHADDDQRALIIAHVTASSDWKHLDMDDEGDYRTERLEAIVSAVMKSLGWDDAVGDDDDDDDDDYDY